MSQPSSNRFPSREDPAKSQAIGPAPFDRSALLLHNAIDCDIAPRRTSRMMSFDCLERRSAGGRQYVSPPGWVGWHGENGVPARLTPARCGSRPEGLEPDQVQGRASCREGSKGRRCTLRSGRVRDRVHHGRRSGRCTDGDAGPRWCSVSRRRSTVDHRRLHHH